MLNRTRTFKLACLAATNDLSINRLFALLEATEQVGGNSVLIHGDLLGLTRNVEADRQDLLAIESIEEVLTRGGDPKLVKLKGPDQAQKALRYRIVTRVNTRLYVYVPLNGSPTFCQER